MPPRMAIPLMVMPVLKFFKKYEKCQGKNVKKNYHKITRFKLSKANKKTKVKVTRSNRLVPREKSCHKEHM
jgi:hypothetical protein